MWEWNDYTKNDLLIESERIMHAGSFRLRPTKIVSRVRLTGRTRGAVNAQPLAYGHGMGMVETRMYDTEAGHIMGLRLGGLNISENVVPMFAHVNRDLFRTLERDLENHYRTGADMGVEYSLAYADLAEPRVPSSITVRLLRNMAFPVGTAYTYAIPALHSATVVQVPPVINRIAIDPQIALLFAQARAAVAGGWTLESYSTDFADWVGRGGLPPVDQRPYAFLDYLYFVVDSPLLPLEGVGTIGKGRVFSTAQRGYIAMANRYAQTGPKVGECWSDVPDDPIKTALVQLGAESGIEIDHISPKSRGGSNAFSNGQVTSRKYNGAKNNTVG